MQRFTVDHMHEAQITLGDQFFWGEILHGARNASGGGNFTPIANFFGTRPVYAENFKDHWRIDCFVRKHPLSPNPKQLGLALVEALKTNQLCKDPIWVSWHSNEELGGEAFGEVFDFD